MSKSIRISDQLAARAEKAARLFHRSPPQQIEHWAQIGRVMESALSYPAQAATKVWGTDQDIDGLIDECESDQGRKKLREVINANSGDDFFSSDPDDPAKVVRSKRID